MLPVPLPPPPEQQQSMGYAYGPPFNAPAGMNTHSYGAPPGHRYSERQSYSDHVPSVHEETADWVPKEYQEKGGYWNTTVGKTHLSLFVPLLTLDFM